MDGSGLDCALEAVDMADTVVGSRNMLRCCCMVCLSFIVVDSDRVVVVLSCMSLSDGMGCDLSAKNQTATG